MASVDPPDLLALWRLVIQDRHPVYLIVGDYSYELVCDSVTGVWSIASDLDVHDEQADRRPFDPAIVYPAAVTKRVAAAAEYARACYDIDVDARIGVAGFDRLATGQPIH